MQPLGDRQWLLMEVAEGTCTVDHERITQAMLQYASNAVRHTHDGSVIQLGSRFAGAGTQRHLSIWITDDGPGIEQEDAARIFERFQRGRSASAPEHSAGAGLGLAIVRAIADAHHGVAWVRSIPGHGATFGIDVHGSAGGAVTGGVAIGGGGRSTGASAGGGGVAGSPQAASNARARRLGARLRITGSALRG